jgi:hypothetical protein
MSSITRYSIAFGIGLMGLSTLSIATGIHDLLSREDEVIVLPQAMKVHAHPSTTLHRFTVKGLSLSSSDRAEIFITP